MLLRSRGIVSLLIAAAWVLAVPAGAQEPWSWPEKPENLQVLPKDWPGSRLRAPMTGFARALGVRCSHCHVGEEGKPLSTYDFVSDENPNKERAREMLRMLGSVNDHLKKIEPSGEQRVNMWCHTCHRGRPRPMTLSEEMEETYKLKGLDAALAHLAQLKKDFYGRGAYDFGGPRALNSLGYAALRNEDPAGAVRVFTMNVEAFPESANAWDSLAEANMATGDVAAARKQYQKSLELDPSNQNAVEMLKKLEGREGE